MTELEYLSAKAVYNEIQELKNFLTDGLQHCTTIIGFYRNKDGLCKDYTREKRLSPQLSDEIIELMRKRLATLEEQFKQM